MEINHLILQHNLAEEKGRQTSLRRDIYQQIATHTDRTFIGLLGARGVGKTVILKQLSAAISKSFYISLDSLSRDEDIFQLILTLHRDYDFQTFLLDEVHYNAGINRHLKLLFDNTEAKIIFTSSVALQLIESAHDLSRRVKIVRIHSFSFREYLRFNQLPLPEKLTWHQIINKSYSSEHIKSLPYFRDYISGKNIPFSLEVKDVLTALRANVEKIIQSDIPKLKTLSIEELPLIKKTFQFVARAPISDVNPNVVANNLKITRYKAVQYIDLLERAFILSKIDPFGTNVLQEPKIFCMLPYRLLERDYEDAIGGMREDFAVHCFLRAGLQLRYLKTKRGSKTPDFLVDDGKQECIVEIGGPQKGFQQFKGIDAHRPKIVFRDASEITQDALPLALLGFL